MSNPNVPPGPRRQHPRFLHPRLSALFLTAPEDGVAPSILLTVYDTKKKPLAQYLYNISEGTSRLMLEHKARPDPKLNAVFLSGCSPAEAGGLGSTVLRLKQDGHALLHLVGPQGIYNCVRGLRSFIQWTHPRVQFLEASNANITFPEEQDPLFLHWGKGKPTIRQACTRADTEKAIQQQQEEQQARWDAMVEKWQQKAGENGPESPFVTVSYEDSYIKTVGFGINVPLGVADSSSDSDDSDGAAHPRPAKPAAASAKAAPGSAAAAKAAAAAYGLAGSKQAKRLAAKPWTRPDWFLRRKRTLKLSAAQVNGVQEFGSSSGDDADFDEADSSSESDAGPWIESDDCFNSGSGDDSGSGDGDSDGGEDSGMATEEPAAAGAAAAAAGQAKSDVNGSKAATRGQAAPAATAAAAAAATATTGAAAFAVGQAGPRVNRRKAARPQRALDRPPSAVQAAPAPPPAADASPGKKRSRQHRRRAAAGQDSSSSSSSSSSDSEEDDSDTTTSSEEHMPQQKKPKTAAAAPDLRSRLGRTAALLGHSRAGAAARAFLDAAIPAAAVAAAAAAAGGSGAQRKTRKRQHQVSETSSSSGASGSTDSESSGPPARSGAARSRRTRKQRRMGHSHSSGSDADNDADSSSGSDDEAEGAAPVPGAAGPRGVRLPSGDLDIKNDIWKLSDSGDDTWPSDSEDQPAAAASDAAAAAAGFFAAAGGAAAAAAGGHEPQAADAADPPGNFPWVTKQPPRRVCLDRLYRARRNAQLPGEEGKSARVWLRIVYGPEIIPPEPLSAAAQQAAAPPRPGPAVPAAAAAAGPTAAAAAAVPAQAAAAAGAMGDVAMGSSSSAGSDGDDALKGLLEESDDDQAGNRSAAAAAAAGGQQPPAHPKNQQQVPGKAVPAAAAAGGAGPKGSSQQQMGQGRGPAGGARQQHGPSSEEARLLLQRQEKLRQQQELWREVMRRRGGQPGIKGRQQQPPPPQQAAQRVQQVGSSFAAGAAAGEAPDRRIQQGRTGGVGRAAAAAAGAPQPQPAQQGDGEAAAAAAARDKVAAIKSAARGARRNPAAFFPSHPASLVGSSSCPGSSSGRNGQQQGTQQRTQQQQQPPQQQQQYEQRMLGYVSHMKAIGGTWNASKYLSGLQAQQDRRPCSGARLGHLCLVLFIRSARELRQLQQHPVLELALQERKHQVAAVIHVVSPEVAGSQAFKDWSQGLPGQQAVVQQGACGTLGEGVSLVQQPQDLEPQPQNQARNIGLEMAQLAAGATAQQAIVQPQPGLQGAPEGEMQDGPMQGAGQQQGLGAAAVAGAAADPRAAAAAAAEARAAAAAGVAAGAAAGVPATAAVGTAGAEVPAAVAAAAPAAAEAPEAQAAAAGVDQIIRGAADDLGFRASARVLARLNLVSKAMFPLPWALRGQAGLAPADLAAVAEEYMQQQQQEEGDGGCADAGMEVDAAADAAASPAAQPAAALAEGAAAAHVQQQQEGGAVQAPRTAAGPLHDPRPPKFVTRHFLQQLVWSGMQYVALKPARIPPLSHKDVMGTQELVKPLDVSTLQRECLMQRPQLQAVLAVLMQKWPELTVAPVRPRLLLPGPGAAQQQQQVGGYRGLSAVRIGGLAAAAGASQPGTPAWMAGSRMQNRSVAHSLRDKLKQQRRSQSPQAEGMDTDMLPEYDLQQQQQQAGQQPGQVEQQAQQQQCPAAATPQPDLLHVECIEGVASPAPAPPAAPAPLTAAQEALVAACGVGHDVSEPSEAPPINFSSSWAPGTQVMFLGTGSAEPSKYRGPSAILLRVVTAGSSRCCCSVGSDSSAAAPAAAAAPAVAGSLRGGDGGAYMLLDAGEGTLGAIHRMYGPEGSREVLLNLGCIWISHKHADHMLGVPGLLQARTELLRQLRSAAVRDIESEALQDVSGMAGVAGDAATDKRDGSIAAGGVSGTGRMDIDSGSASDSDGDIDIDSSGLGDSDGASYVQRNGSNDGSGSSTNGSRSKCASCLMQVPPLLLVGPVELQDWVKKQPGSSTWDYVMVGVEAFAGTAPPVLQQQRFWQQQQQQGPGGCGIHNGVPTAAAGNGRQQQNGRLSGQAQEQQKQQQVQQLRLQQHQALLLQQQQAMLAQQQQAVMMMQAQQQQMQLQMRAAGMMPGMHCTPYGMMMPQAAAVMMQGPCGYGPMGQSGPMYAGMGSAAVGMMPGPGQMTHPGGMMTNSNGMMSNGNGVMAQGRGVPPLRPPPGPPPPCNGSAAAAGKPSAPPVGKPAPPSGPPPVAAAANGMPAPPPGPPPPAAAVGGQRNGKPAPPAGPPPPAAAATTGQGPQSNGGVGGDSSWCLRMPPNQLQRWQQWAASCWSGNAAAGVMSGVFGFTGWRSVAVQHCHGAQGLVLEHSQGWKLVYSGDTRPCDALVAAGAGATLCIHEATFEACMESHARAKSHSTLQEALEVTERMGAYRTVLTHFSQRYPGMPADFPASATPWHRRPLLAVDGAVVRFDLLPMLPALMPAVAAALQDLQEGDEGQGPPADAAGGEAGDHAMECCG